MAKKPEFTDDFLEKIRIAASMGATDIQLAHMLKVSDRTIYRWKKEPAFCQAIKKGKDDADLNVVNSLYRRATGGSEVACIFWLKNRRPLEWRDRHDVQVPPPEGASVIHIEVVHTKGGAAEGGNGKGNGKGNGEGK
jgi:hypothetical protein